MADLNQAFNLNYNGRNLDNYMNDLNKKIKVIDPDLAHNSNIIGTNFSPYHAAFDRVKVSNQRYDNITRISDKPTYGYECQLCGKCIGYHLSLEDPDSVDHDFVKGKFRPLTIQETGAFVNGHPLFEQ